MTDISEQVMDILADEVLRVWSAVAAAFKGSIYGKYGIIIRDGDIPDIIRRVADRLEA